MGVDARCGVGASCLGRGTPRNAARRAARWAGAAAGSTAGARACPLFRSAGAPVARRRPPPAGWRWRGNGVLAYELHLTKSTCVGVRGVAPVEVGVDEFAEELVVRREEGIELRPSGAKRGVGRGGSARVGGRDCARRPAGRGVHTCGLTRSRAARAAWEALESSRFVKDSGFFFAERACGRWEVGGGGRRRAARRGCGCCAAAKGETEGSSEGSSEEGRTSHWLALRIWLMICASVWRPVKFESSLSSAGAFIP